MREHIPLEHLRQTVDGVCEDPGWIIFYVHDVRDNPSPGGCTPAYMEAVLKLVAGRCRILTVARRST